jgi:hypothetical protein
VSSSATGDNRRPHLTAVLREGKRVTPLELSVELALDARSSRAASEGSPPARLSEDDLRPAREPRR